MYLMPQGQNPAKLIEALEKRIELLENVVKTLQLDTPAKRGRPAKVKDDSRFKSDSPSGD